MKNTIVLDRVKREEDNWPRFDSRDRRKGENDQRKIENSHE